MQAMKPSLLALLLVFGLASAKDIPRCKTDGCMQQHHNANASLDNRTASSKQYTCKRKPTSKSDETPYLDQSDVLPSITLEVEPKIAPSALPAQDQEEPYPAEVESGPILEPIDTPQQASEMINLEEPPLFNQSEVLPSITVEVEAMIAPSALPAQEQEVVSAPVDLETDLTTQPVNSNGNSELNQSDVLPSITMEAEAEPMIAPSALPSQEQESLKPVVEPTPATQPVENPPKTEQQAQPQLPVLPMPQIDTSAPEAWEFSSQYHVTDRGYFRLATRSPEISVKYIQGTLDATLYSIKLGEVRDRLARARPIYLISKSARDFPEFMSRFGGSATGDGRTLLDLMGFGTNKPIPGYLSSDFEGCDHPYYEEDIPFHEFAHTIHIDGFTDQMKARIQELYDKYKVASPHYNINSYAFANSMEFFAEMSQVFCEVTVRKDVTAGLDKAGIHAHMPELYSFLDSLFDVTINYIKRASCANPCASRWSRCAA